MPTKKILEYFFNHEKRKKIPDFFSSYEKLEDEESNVDRHRDVSFTKEVQMILKCNRVGFENDDIGPNISKYGAEYNANDFERIYLEEKKKTDDKEDAFTRSIKRYLKKPVLISIVCYSIGIVLLFMVKVIKNSIHAL